MKSQAEGFCFSLVVTLKICFPSSYIPHTAKFLKYISNLMELLLLWSLFESTLQLECVTTQFAAEK